VENPRGLGTVIHPNSDLDASETGEILLPEPVSLERLGYLQMVDQGHKKLPTAVTIKECIVVLNVHSNRKSVSHGFLAGIFGALDRYGVVVDLISTSEVHISMAIEDTHERKVMDRLVRDLEKYGTVSPRSRLPHVLPVEGNEHLKRFRCRSLYSEGWRFYRS
jgi:aspartate kinase